MVLWRKEREVTDTMHLILGSLILRNYFREWTVTDSVYYLNTLKDVSLFIVTERWQMSLNHKFSSWWIKTLKRKGRHWPDKLHSFDKLSLLYLSTELWNITYKTWEQLAYSTLDCDTFHIFQKAKQHRLFSKPHFSHHCCYLY